MAPRTILLLVAALSSAVTAVPADEVVPRQLHVLGGDNRCAAAFSINGGNKEQSRRAELKMMPCQSATVTTFYEVRSKIGRRPGTVIVYPAQDSPRQAKLACQAMSVATEPTYGTSQPGDEVFIDGESFSLWGRVTLVDDPDGLNSLEGFRICDMSVLSDGPCAGSIGVCNRGLECGGLCAASDGKRVVLKPCEEAVNDGSILVINPTNSSQISGGSRPSLCP